METIWGFKQRSNFENYSRKNNLMTKKEMVVTAIGIVIGAVAGYLYYFYIGCASGTCAITSKPLNSTLYGALMGGLILNLFIKSPKKSA